MSSFIGRSKSIEMPINELINSDIHDKKYHLKQVTL